MIKSAARTRERSDYKPHRHQNTSELLYITAGTGRVKAYGQVTPVSAGDIIFCPRGTEHTGPGGDCELIYIIADVPIPNGMHWHFVVRDDEMRTVGGLFEIFYDFFSRPDSETACKSMETAFCELIFEMVFQIRRQSELDEEVSALYNAITRGMSEPDFSVGEAMREITPSLSDLRRRFCESIGMNPSRYLNDVRIRHAKKLIAQRSETALSLAQIAYSCGFRDERYFTRVFKRYCGMTPSEYYKQVI